MCSADQQCQCCSVIPAEYHLEKKNHKTNSISIHSKKKIYIYPSNHPALYTSNDTRKEEKTSHVTLTNIFLHFAVQRRHAVDPIFMLIICNVLMSLPLGGCQQRDVTAIPNQKLPLTCWVSRPVYDAHYSICIFWFLM